MLIIFAIQLILFAVFGIAVASLVVILTVERVRKYSSNVVKVSDEVDYLDRLGIN